MATLQQERKDFESLGSRYAADRTVTITEVQLAGITNYWFTPPMIAGDEVVVYLHGGGFIYGSIRSHRAMVSHFAAALKRKILFVEYSLAPEKPFPFALQETTSVIHELLRQTPGLRFFVMGDSAGGNLAMSTALNLKSLHLPMPEGQVLLSPWTNMKTVYDSYTENEKHDPILTKSFIDYAASLYTGKTLTDPLASPVLGSFRDFNPTLIVTGALEILRDDAVHLHEALQKAGSVSTLEVFPDPTHVWTLTDIASPDSRKTLKLMSAFVDQVTKKNREAVN